MMKSNFCKYILMLFLLTCLSSAISIKCSSGGNEDASSIISSYDLDISTHLAQSLRLGDSRISSSLSVDGSGTNNMYQTASNKEAIVSNSLISIGTLSSSASGYAGGGTVAIDRSVQITGQSESIISVDSGSNYANQKSGVLDGSMTLSQTAIAQPGTVNALQSWNIAGVLGYADGTAQFSDNIVKITGGLNGAGVTRGFIAATACDDASASGSIQADSLDSKAYSAVKSASADGDAYSYLSSADHLASSVSGSANGHVTTNQDLFANGDVRVFASSTSDDSSSKSYDAKGESVSGSMSASAGSPAIIDTNLVGDIQTSTSGLIPTPGSWVWNGFGGVVTSNPYQLQADGRSHIFVKGGDNGLWDNLDGDWQGLGGVLASDPYAIRDAQGKIHVLVKGSDGALWDRILGESWVGLGGYITSNPSAVLSLDNTVKVVVRGGDNALWQRDLTTGEWSSLGGVIASNPQAILDNNGKMHVLVKGGDGGLWDNVDGIWQSRGGHITSDAKPIIDPFNPGFIYTSVRGGDGALWSNALDTTLGTSTWTGLGGFIQGNPAPVVDTDGVLHNFVRGGDSALWDNANGGWYSLGGVIKSDLNAIKDKDGKLRVAAVGGDNGLWVNTVGIDLPPTTLVGSFACDYNKIQTAVDSISSGGIVKVLSGTYKENINIDKSLTIRGAGASKTTVDGQLAGSVFTIGLINPNVDVILSDITATNGKANSGGGIRNNGRLTLNDVLLKDNKAQNGGDGGGIYNYYGTVNLNSGSIAANTASNGGGVFNWYGTVNINGGSITGSTAIWGGGIHNYFGTVNMNAGSIDKNAGSNGGGIYNNAGTVNLYGGSIAENSAKYGGGIYNYHNLATPTLNLNGGSITGNIAQNEGAGIYNQGIINFNSGSIAGNRAGSSGGGISSGGDGSTVNMNGGIISDNTATVFGGGISNYRGKLKLNGGSVTRNTASEFGGGIYSGTTGVTFSGTQIAVTDNSAFYTLGAAWYQQYGVCMDYEPTMLNGFDPAMQVYGNTHI